MICLIIYVLAFSDCVFFVPLRINFLFKVFSAKKKVAYESYQYFLAVFAMEIRDLSSGRVPQQDGN